MRSVSKHSATTRPTVLAIGLAGMLACASDQAITAPETPGFDMQSSSTRITVHLAAKIDGFIRDGNLVVDNSVVQTLHVPSFEDRGVIEFDLRRFSGPVLRAMLRLPVFGSKGPYPFRVDLYGYRANATLDIGDWDRGTFITSFQYAGEPEVVLDVTSKVRGMISTGTDFAGFNFRAERSDIDDNGPYVAFNSREYPPRTVLNIRTEAAP